MPKFATGQVAVGKGTLVVNARGIARLGMLAVGGIGAAVASAPGVASADSSADWLSSIDTLLGSLSVRASSSSDFQISIDGYDLLPTADNTATATSETGDIAIADGSGSVASAYVGSGDFAEAVGQNALAVAGGTGTDTGSTAGNDDTAIDIGNNDLPTTGYYDGAYACNADLIDNLNGGIGSNDTAIDRQQHQRRQCRRRRQ